MAKASTFLLVMGAMTLAAVVSSFATMFVMAHQHLVAPGGGAAGSASVQPTRIITTTAAAAAGAAAAALEPKEVPGLEGFPAAVFLPKARGFASDQWRPLIFRECLPGMPPDWAPCLKVDNLEVAEEWLYADFKLLRPRFVDPSHAEQVEHALFYKPPKTRRDPDHVHYYNQNGRNLRFRDTGYTGTPPTQWHEAACMVNEQIPPEAFSKREPPGGGGARADVMFAASPDSHSFQHFLDRVAIMLMQTEHLRTQSTEYLTPGGPRVIGELWKIMTNTSSPKLVPPGHVYAKSFLFACDTPLLHPFTTQRLFETVMVAAGVDPGPVPKDERKIIVTLPRNDGAEHHGRKWVNYDECEAAIKAYLDKRGKGEVVKPYRTRDFPTLLETAAWWHKNVRAVVAMHGGGMYNVLWSSDDTPVIELRPTLDGQSQGGTLFWEVTSLRNLTYWTIPVQAKDRKWDSTVNCDQVVKALSTSLEEQRDPRGHVLSRWYQGSFRPGFR